jgi:hypothetical protein
LANSTTRSFGQLFAVTEQHRSYNSGHKNGHYLQRKGRQEKKAARLLEKTDPILILTAGGHVDAAFAQRHQYGTGHQSRASKAVEVLSYSKLASSIASRDPLTICFCSLLLNFEYHFEILRSSARLSVVRAFQNPNKDGEKPGEDRSFSS